MKRHTSMKTFGELIFAALLICKFSSVTACTNLIYHYKKTTFVARNFDWMNNHVDVVVNPVGMARETLQLKSGERPLKWRAKYGSVTFNMTNSAGKMLATAVQGGMNQAGLVVSLLEFDGAEFQPLSHDIPNINNTYLTQYWLDRFSTVKQAVAALKHLNVVTTWWHGKSVPIHYVLRDAAGHSAIIDYINGQRHVYLGQTLAYRALTNTSFKRSQQLAETLLNMSTDHVRLAGYGSEARYLRALAFLHRMPSPASRSQAMAYGFAALQDVAEPLGSPWPTQWSVVYDTRHLMLFYRTVNNPHIRQINFKQVPFRRQCTFPISQLKFILDDC